MTIIQLEYLLAVANCGSFSLAAEHCFVTQPSLSMQVKALEEELGVVLLDRSKKPVIPTEAGDVVLERARETLRAYNNIRESVAELKGETSGKLRLGVIPTIAPYLLHKFIPAFVRDYPKVELEISEMITSDIVEALKRDRIDAALVASGTCGEGILEQELFNDRFFAYDSPENALYERSNIRIEDIDLRDLVILSAGNCMRDQIIELCQAKRDMPSHYSFESGSLDTLMRIVDCTSCLTIIPEMAVEYIPADHGRRAPHLRQEFDHQGPDRYDYGQCPGGRELTCFSRNGRVRRFFLPGAFCFSDAVLSVPVCGALLLRSVLRRCSRLVPCRCSALCRVVILGLHRLPSPFVPCRRSDLRRIVIRCLRRVAVPVCGWPPPENSADGLAGNLCGLRVSCGLSLRCDDSGRVARPLFCSS